MIFASLAIGLVLIPVLGAAVFAWMDFRANTPRWAPVRVRHPEGRSSTPVR